MNGYIKREWGWDMSLFYLLSLPHSAFTMLSFTQTRTPTSITCEKYATISATSQSQLFSPLLKKSICKIVKKKNPTNLSSKNKNKTENVCFHFYFRRRKSKNLLLIFNSFLVIVSFTFVIWTEMSVVVKWIK